MLQHNVLTILLGVKLSMESSNVKNKGLVHTCVCVVWVCAYVFSSSRRVEGGNDFLEFPRV